MQNLKLEMKGKMKIKVGGRIIDAEVCDNFFSQARGLMFRKKLGNLLFVFDRPTKIGIHSFFVRNSFLAIWMLGETVDDKRIISPWKFSIKPKTPFDKLIETPFASETEILEFLDGSQKHLNSK